MKPVGDCGLKRKLCAGVDRIMNMDYRYVSIFHVSGIKLPNDKSEMLLVNSTSTRTKIVFQSDIDQLCYFIDRGAAIGSMMLESLFGKEDTGPVGDRIDKRIKLIRDDRRKRFGSGPFVVFEFSGEVDVHPSKPTRDLGEFIVSYDLVDKNQIRNQFKKEIDQLLISFFLIVERYYELKKVTDGMYLLDESSKVWYSFTLTTSAKIDVLKTFDDTSLHHLSDYSSALAKTFDLENVYRLVVQSSDKDSDNLESFLFGWTALEVFVNKTFKEYEQKFFKEYLVSEATFSAQKFFDRLRDVMKGKYSLKDKFTVISAYLSNEPEKDLKEFVSAQKVRNNLSHGKRIDESKLPTERIIFLLRKYLQNHLAPIS